MKTKAQKGKELEKGKTLLAKSNVVIFTDFSNVSAADINKLRKQLKESGSAYMVMKKRLLNILFKERGIGVDATSYSSQVGTIFSPEGMEKASGPLFKFFSALGGETKSAREESVKKILGGYDIKANAPVTGDMLRFIGQLPPREALLSQLAGMIAAPVRSLLYVLQERSKQMVETK